MTANLIALLVAWAVGLTFFLLRRPFLTAMIDAQLAEMRLVGYELERLACKGGIDRNSAFYRTFREVAMNFSSIRAEQFPSFPLLVLAIASKERRSEDHDRAVSRAAWAEACGRYRAHEELPKRLLVAMGSVLQYRSVTLWACGYLYALVMMTRDQAGELARLFRALVGVFDTAKAPPDFLLHPRG